MYYQYHFCYNSWIYVDGCTFLGTRGGALPRAGDACRIDISQGERGVDMSQEVPHSHSYVICRYGYEKIADRDHASI